MDQMMNQDPQAQETPGEYQSADQDNGGYTVCIKVTPDGKFSVGVETAQQEASEQQAGSESGGSYTPAGDVKSALTMALEIIRNDGQMPDESGQAEFDSGYTNRMPA
jgi:hypothetical protein